MTRRGSTSFTPTAIDLAMARSALQSCPRTLGELATYCGMETRIASAVITELQKLGEVAFDSHSRCYSWVGHEPKLDIK